VITLHKTSELWRVQLLATILTLTDRMCIAVDFKSEKIVSSRVTKGNVHDSKKFSSMMRRYPGHIILTRCMLIRLMTIESFNSLDNLNIESAIQIRKNASTKAKGIPLRRDEVANQRVR